MITTTKVKTSTHTSSILISANSREVTCFRFC